MGNILKKFLHGLTSAHFSKGYKYFLSLTCLILSLAFLENWILKFYFNPLSTDDYYWFYSTVAQSVAALFGIGGMFAAYVLGKINEEIKGSYSDARKKLASLMPEVNFWKDNEFLSAAENYLKSHKQDQNQNKIRILENEMHIMKSKEGIKRVLVGLFKNVLLFMSVIILLSLLALLFSSYLSELTLGFVFAIFLLVLILITVSKMARFIYGAIHS